MDKGVEVIEESGQSKTTERISGAATGYSKGGPGVQQKLKIYVKI